MLRTLLSPLLLILAIPVVTASYAAVQMASISGGWGGWAISMAVIAAAGLACVAICIARRQAR